MPSPIEALRALLDDHEKRYGRGEVWRNASEAMAAREAPKVSVAGRMERSLADHERACLVLLEAEQMKPSPDNALVSTLCESVRMMREYCDAVKRGLAAPPAPPAAECADPLAPIVACMVCGKPVHTCERAISQKGDYRCPAHPEGVELSDGKWVCSDECGNTVMPPTAECAVCGGPGCPTCCQGLREELAMWTDAHDFMNRKAAESMTECASLRARLADAVRTWEELAKQNVDRARANGRLAAELAKAVDALRPFAEYYRKLDHYPTDDDYAIVGGIVAAYDAKHGEGKK